MTIFFGLEAVIRGETAKIIKAIDQAETNAAERHQELLAKLEVLRVELGRANGKGDRIVEILTKPELDFQVGKPQDRKV